MTDSATKGPDAFAAAVAASQPVEKPDPIMRHFRHAHLPDALAAVASPFCRLAHHVVSTLPRNAERTVALRKLLEAKDAAVRAALPDEE